MTREEIVTALRCCAFNSEDSCEHCTECPAAGDDCESELQFAAAELIESQRQEIEALRRANEGLRFNLDLWMGHARKTVGADAPVGPQESVSAPPGRTESSAPTTMREGVSGDEICRAALETFGEMAQMAMAVEEMSELTKELCKYRRGRNNVESIAEEIADVQIILRQLVILFDCKETVDKYRQYKLERLAGRVEEVRGQ